MKKRSLLLSLSLALLLILLYLFLGNPLVLLHNARLRRSAADLDPGAVTLNEVVPFPWDRVYTFAPYDTQEEIEEIIGFHSRSVKANCYSEGMCHLLFVKGGRVTASILGHPRNLGYTISFPGGYIDREDRVVFSVTREDGFLSLYPA